VVVVVVDTMVREMNRVVRGADWLEETDFTEAAPRSIWLSYFMALGVVLLFLGRFWSGWEVTV
jgi:hypothetical protein